MEIAVVRPGDSLWAIASRYGVTPAHVVQANQLSHPDRLVPGMALVIPVERRHVVQPGDTLWRIGQQYGTTPQAIAQQNRISLTEWIFPGQILRIPRGARPVIEANAYEMDMGPTGVETTRAAAPYLTYISPFTAKITGEGDLTLPNMGPVTAAAHQGGAATLLTIVNGDFELDVTHAFLGNPAAQDRALGEIIALLKAGGHHGLNVDFEHMYPEDREPYNAFLRRARPRLHALGFSLSTALAPKMSATQRGFAYEAHDYRAHGELADFVVLMTYEWGYRKGPPMAIAPLDQVRRVLDYAVTEIPRQKILMGMPLYARDWTLPFVRGGPEAETFSPVSAVERAVRYGVAIQYDPVAQSPFYHYRDGAGRDHEVWFEDARSVQAKFDAVKAYGLRGVSYWVLGNPFPQNWLLLADNFQVRKLRS